MAEGQRILIVDDDQSILDLLLDILKQEGFEATACSCAHEALKALESTPYDLALLDVMMPDMDGFELCQAIRQTSKLPVMFLTARGESIDKVTGLTIGADDYITKPFETHELIARVKAHLRRDTWNGANNDNETLTFGDLALHPKNHECFLKGIPLELTPKEFAILHLLMEEPSVPHSVREIFEIAWGESYYEAGGKSVMVHIRRLRKKIALTDSAQTYIATIWGVGYKLQA